LRSQTEKKTDELELKKPIIQPTTKTVPTGRFEIVPFHHQYSVDHIMLSLSFVLSAASSLRGASRCLETIITHLQLSLPVPSWYTIRLWLLRLGYYKLTRPKELATDWIWIVDHTIQLGEEKALVILGIRMCEIPSSSCLKYEDMEPITLLPVKHSNGEIVYEQLEKTIEKTGVPREILGDYGSDLKVGVETFCQEHPETDYVHDIKHFTAILLKRELQNDEEWINFTSLATKTKKQLQQTSLAFLSPPNQRTKARYMNVDILVQWGQKTLDFLDNKSDTNDKNKILEKLGWLYDYRDSLFEWEEIMQVIGHTESHLRKNGYFFGCHMELKNLLADNMATRSLAISEQVLNFVKTQESKLKPRERLLASSEIIESVFGKQKYLEHEQSKNGFTGLLLGIAAIVASTTTEVVFKALETVPTQKILTWCKEHLGQTLQGKRIEAYATPVMEQK